MIRASNVPLSRRPQRRDRLSQNDVRRALPITPRVCEWRRSLSPVFRSDNGVTL
jgi:hypothetical protein